MCSAAFCTSIRQSVSIYVFLFTFSRENRETVGTKMLLQSSHIILLSLLCLNEGVVWSVFFFFLKKLSVLLCALYLVMSDGVCTVAEWDIIVQNKSSSQSQCHGWAGHLWHCAWQVWYVGVGRDVLQHLHCAALGAFLSFSCQLCIFPKEHAAQLFSERRH